MKVVAIIQARTSSTRLPKKVLMPLPYDSDIPSLGQMIRRVKRAKTLDEIIVATTVEEEDRAVAEVAEKFGVKAFRGSKEDVLERYYLCAKEFRGEVVVRLTGDCPCIDWELIDMCVNEFKKRSVDYLYLTNMPRGLDVEVFTFEVLEASYKEAKENFQREHVTPYMRHSGRFKVSQIEPEPFLRRPDIRITLDTIEDYALLCAVFDYLYYENEFFSARDIVNLFEKKGWLKLINGKVRQKKVNLSLKEEIEEAIKVLDLQELKRAKSVLETVLRNLTML